MDTQKPKTWLIDIDGVIFRHRGTGASEQWHAEPELLPDVIEKLNIIESLGHRIILMTARPTTLLNRTQKQLERHGVPYHHLIMGCTSGERIIVNDAKASGSISCRAMCLPRNTGLGDL